jgi:hypothetical protein
MSTLAVNAVTDANGGNTATINSMTPTADSLQGFRNRIINGDMRIDQRNAGAAVTNPGDATVYLVDRWNQRENTAAQLTFQQVSDAPAGFVNSMKVTVTTADASIAASDYSVFRQFIEGNNIADLGWGSANAKPITLSFWVRSSVTGTYGGRLANSAVNRNYVFSYSVSAANTWEYKTITIAGDTSGTWATNNDIGIRVDFCLTAGTDYTGSAGSWGSTSYFTVTGNTPLISTLNATWYITGVQLEVGSVATPFERRPYGTELALCQRYLLSYGGSNTVSQALASGVLVNTTTFTGYCGFPCEMRAAPTLTTVGSFNLRSESSFDATVTGGSFGTESASVTATVSGATAGQGAVLRSAGNTLNDGVLLFSAEL